MSNDTNSNNADNSAQSGGSLLSKVVNQGKNLAACFLMFNAASAMLATVTHSPEENVQFGKELMSMTVNGTAGAPAAFQNSPLARLTDKQPSARVLYSGAVQVTGLMLAPGAVAAGAIRQAVAEASAPAARVAAPKPVKAAGPVHG